MSELKPSPKSSSVSEFYWKMRCRAAERYIYESPCDPDITKEQMKAYKAWQKFVDKE